MALKLIEETAPEGLEHLYKEADGKFVLDVEGYDPSETEKLKTEYEQTKKKLSEFRDHNISLRSQLEKASAAGDSNGDDGPKIQELIDQAVKELKTRLDSVEGEKKQLSSQLEEVVLSDRIKDLAVKHGVFESALPDVVARAKHTFAVKEGKPVPLDNKFRDAEGNALTPDSWITQLQSDAPHLFKSSNGTGARGSVGQHGSSDGTTLSPVQKIAAGLSGKTQTKSIM